LALGELQTATTATDKDCDPAALVNGQQFTVQLGVIESLTPLRPSLEERFLAWVKPEARLD